MLEVVKAGGYNFTENLPTYPEGEGELYKTINVNIDVDSYYNNGYNQGKIDGVNEQKGKLETINITENGTYTKEDGYNKVVVEVPDLNGSYNEGYNQGKIDGINEQKSKLESISITENGTYDKEDGYNHIEVNVNAVPKINVKEAGIKFGQSTFTKVPEWADFNGIYDMSYMFSNCKNLQTIPQIDTSNATNMSYMFYNCNSLQTIPQIDTSNVTNMNNMFYNFTGNKTLISLPKFNCQKVTNIISYFSYYADGMSVLTDVGGWENLKCEWNDKYGLASCPNLTYQSCINILNGLYDFVGNGESIRRTLKVHPNFLTTVGEEISIGTAKGWTISA